MKGRKQMRFNTRLSNLLGDEPTDEEVKEAFESVTSKLARIINTEGGDRLTDGYITQVYADEIRQNRAEKKYACNKSPGAQSTPTIIINISINVKAKQ